ncbi:MAG: helix-turn-helix transcriptional regulator [Sandaracinus sp.]|nr:helix-turn-helix transcriptional regulator [Sandaracinus sp.]MCB9636147.1 helix-turn-helix transcriptional regulator [Sandaracinus sp.]
MRRTHRMSSPDATRSLHAGELDRATAEGAPKEAVEAFAFLLGEAAEPTWADDESSTTARAFAAIATLGEVDAPTIGVGAWRRVHEGLAAWANGERVSTWEPTREDPARRVAELALRALFTLDDDPDEALRSARLASRAAYAEALRVEEWLAYWVLARVRRTTGSAYAAARILGALARAAPPTWWPLVDWELALAGGDAQAAGRSLSAPADLWVNLSRGEGDVAELANATLPAPFARDRDALLGGLRGDSLRYASLGPVAGALHASAARSGVSPALWHVTPDTPATLRWCVAPHAAPLVLAEEGERVRALAAILAEAGPGGRDEQEVFRAVYGFAFEPAVHDGVFRVLLHRARVALEAVAEIDREGERWVLRPRAPFVLTEPRSEPPFGDQVLRLLASAPGQTAKELAERSGVHVRQVQRALRLLVDTGACQAEKRGRQVVYAVEDTTFAEPTHFRREAAR